MEELSIEVKIIGPALCIAAIILLATGGKLMEKLRRSPKSSKMN